MKKNINTEPDVADLINKIQEKLVGLEQKIDILISKSSSRPAEARPSNPFYQERRFGRDQRTLHKAICAECGSECEVPFKPTGERPVYCKECFSKRKGGGSFNERPDNKPREDRHGHADHSERHRGGDKRKTSPRKKPFHKKRKG